MTGLANKLSEGWFNYTRNLDMLKKQNHGEREAMMLSFIMIT